MTRTLAATLLLVLLAPLPAPAEDPPAESPRKITGRLETRDGIQVLRLWGTPRERGFAHGYLLAEPIVLGIERDLRILLGERASQMIATLGPLLNRAFAFSPEETAELEGMLEGIRAKLPPEKRRIPLLDRELGVDELKLANTAGDWYALACSSAALWGDRSRDGTPTVVRNFDFRALELFIGSPHIRVAAPRPGEPARRGWIGVSHPGCIGTLTAMNADGVFLAVHDVGIRPTMKDLAQPNVPRLLAVRRLLESLAPERACETARDRLREWPTLYGNNFVIATPRSGDGLPAGVLEYDTREKIRGGVDLRGSAPAAEGEAKGSFVVCSNHFRVRGQGRCGRYDRLATGCRSPWPEEGPSVEDLFALASRSAVPAPGRVVPAGGFGTLHQAVARTGARELWVRFTKTGENVRDARPIRFAVGEMLRTGDDDDR